MLAVFLLGSHTPPIFFLFFVHPFFVFFLPFLFVVFLSSFLQHFFSNSITFSMTGWTIDYTHTHIQMHTHTQVHRSSGQSGTPDRSMAPGPTLAKGGDRGPPAAPQGVPSDSPEPSTRTRGTGQPRRGVPLGRSAAPDKSGPVQPEC